MGLTILLAGVVGAWVLPSRSSLAMETPAGHEPTDASVRGVLAAAVGLMMLMAIALVLVSSIFAALTGRPVTLHPPAAAPQPNPPAELATVRATEARRLNSYAWVNRERGIVQIPIERAMDLVAQRGLPARAAAPATTPLAPTSSPTAPSAAR